MYFRANSKRFQCEDAELHNLYASGTAATGTVPVAAVPLANSNANRLNSLKRCFLRIHLPKSVLGIDCAMLFCSGTAATGTVPVALVPVASIA